VRIKRRGAGAIIAFLTKTNAFGLSLEALENAALTLGERAYRGHQLYVWLYRKRVRSFGEMTNVSRPLRDRLAEGHDLSWPDVVERQVSTDGTVKYLFGLDDGATVESVFIPEEKRRTICISTQAGCPLKCAFCLTGIAGYKRNLKTWEILGQVATVMADAPPARFGWNIVVMGMGEPLLNYDATVAALRILMDPKGFAVAPKKLTLSTVGILPALEKLMEEPVRPNLAISLHASNAELRRTLMPIEEKYSIEEVMSAARRYPIPHGGRVTYEYVLLGGVNDSPSHARELARRLRGSRSKVNLIPLNPAPEIPFAAPAPSAIDAFCRVLADAHVTVSVRRPRGQDILAACGQLHLRAGATAEAAVAAH
jgi:23S rRNA (adenine2503-C2)-methyltransferase